MKVEMTVDWDELPNEAREDSNHHKRYPKIPTSRAERRLYFIALARHIEDLIDTGQTDSLAHIARMCLVSRARISQILSTHMNLG